MARSRSQTLTEAELPIMAVLWESGPCTGREVLDALPREVAYNTVLTLLRILERKGYVSHRQDGRTFVWRAKVDRDKARRSVVESVVRRFFEGSPELLVLNVIETEKLDADEIARLRRALESEKEDA